MSTRPWEVKYIRSPTVVPRLIHALAWFLHVPRGEGAAEVRGPCQLHQSE